MDNNKKKATLVILGITIVCLLTVAYLLSVGNDTSPPKPVESEPGHTNKDVTRNEGSETNQTTAADSEAATDPLSDWQQLTLEEKLDLNPYNCPADDSGVIHLREDNGQCLPIPAEAEELADQTQEETGNETAKGIRLGQAFAYSPDLDVTIHSLICRQVDVSVSDRVSELTNARFWFYPKATYTNYDNPGTGERIDNIQAGVGQNASQRCRIIMHGQNTGADRYLPDGCGLIFENSVSLVGQQDTYGALQFQRICTKNIIDFPNGATDREILYFAISSEDTIVQINISNRFSGEIYTIPVFKRRFVIPETSS